MKILFVGWKSGTAGHRFRAIGRLGHQTHLVDPERTLSKKYVWRKFHTVTGGKFCEREVEREVLRGMGDERFDLAWVDSGRYIGPSLIAELKRRCGFVVNYNTDDPLGSRDGRMWTLYRKAIPFYDMLVVMREPNIQEAYASGARHVHRVFMCADEVAHQPRILEPQERTRWQSEVLFLGTYMTERGPFLANLIRRGVPLSIRGNLWPRAAEWPILRQAWVGSGTTIDDEYAKLIQGARVCLGLLSKGNRDLHTTRTMEIPMLGGLLCAERTSEHLELYQEGEEAVYWSDADECAEVCKQLLDDEPRRLAIAAAGRRRCVANGNLNETMIGRVLAEAAKIKSGPAG